MSTNIFENQQEIIQYFLSAISSYERNKADIEAQFQREKKAIESDLKIAIEADKRNLSDVNYKANNVITSIHQQMEAAQDTINRSKWKHKVEGGIPYHLVIVARTPIFQQMEIYEERARRARHEIDEAADHYRTPSNMRSANTSLSIGIALLVILITNIILFISLWHYINLSFLNIIITFIFFLLTFRLTYFILSRMAYFKSLKRAYATLLQSTSTAENLHQQQITLTQAIHQQQIATLQKTYQQKLDKQQALYGEQTRLLNQALARDIAEIKKSSDTLISEVGLPGINWNDPQWKQWRVSRSHSIAARIGILSTSIDRNILSIPVLLACPGNQNILFKASGVSKNIAIAAIQSLMLRLLAAHSPGKVQFTLVDPVGLGQNVSLFMQLTDYNKDLAGSKAWSETKDIDSRLADLSEKMSVIIQRYLRGQYKTIEEYNQQAGEVAEPYRILVVIGFPVKFSQEAATRLIEIAANGPKCGVSTIVMWDTEQPPPYNFNLADLERLSTVIAWKGQYFVGLAEEEDENKDIEKCQLILDTPPSLELFNHILEEVGKGSIKPIKVPFERIAPPPQEWWKGDTRENVKVPLGRAGATRLQYMSLGEGTAVHALVAGQTRSGKTNLLHVLLTTLSLKYSPDELEFHLVDFKQVGFTPFATAKLPHARVVAVDSEREFCLSVIQGLNNELERRKNIFSTAGVQKIAEYRKAYPTIRMPRILLVVDEFQEFFIEDDTINKDAALLLDRLVRQGGAFGIHVILCSQTLAGNYTLPRSTIGQMAIRIALQSSDVDARIVLSDENAAARLLSRPGEAIYNAKNGLVEGNESFQSALLPDEELDEYLERIQEFARQSQRNFSPAWEQIVFNGRDFANPEKNKLLEAALTFPSWPSPQKTIIVWLGDPIAIKYPTSVQFRPVTGNNLLIVGQQAETALGMLITILFSLTTQFTPSRVRFYIVDFSPKDMPFAGALKLIGQALPYKVQIVNRLDFLHTITEVADEVDERMEQEEIAPEAIYLIIYGLQRTRDLRSEDDFMSSYGSGDATPGPSKRFATILREGPELGVHTIAWCDTLTNLNRTLERGLLREFEMRVAFQMSQEDSINLIDSPAASKFGEFSQYRAALFSEETGRLEKFRPYSLPSNQWIQKAVNNLRQKRELLQ